MQNENIEYGIKGAEKIENYLLALTNQHCTKIVSAVGTWFDLYLNDSPQQGIFISDAAWRLEQHGSSICSSAFPSHGPVDESGNKRIDLLEVLLNKKFIDFRIRSPVYDLSLHFEDGLILRIFCQGVAQPDYSLQDGERRISVHAHYQEEEIDSDSS